MYLERVCATMHILFYFLLREKNICYYEKKQFLRRDVKWKIKLLKES